MIKVSMWLGLWLACVIGDPELIQQKLQIPKGQTPGETVGTVALSFLNTPYVARTLEQPGDEQLVVNLRELDCTTFVENVLALTQTIESDTLTVDHFKHQLARYRYDQGKVQGYGSRQHYFSSFLQQLVRYGDARLMAEEWGGVPYNKPIDFMTKHRNLYAQLADSQNFERVQSLEQALNQVQKYYIPKDKLPAIESKLRTGDIIGITSAKAGLDVSHEGFAYQKGGKVYLLHASTDQKKVVISAEPLAAYLNRHRDQTGIIVARLQ
ncbi:hypothetical protein BWI93_27000 [Siphonobacter sp. BAB-5385]|nr:hypothetical protein BWI93_27000 [Siphonobacter sp. BAB-5385]